MFQSQNDHWNKKNLPYLHDLGELYDPNLNLYQNIDLFFIYLLEILLTRKLIKKTTKQNLEDKNFTKEKKLQKNKIKKIYKETSKNIL